MFKDIDELDQYLADKGYTSIVKYFTHPSFVSAIVGITDGGNIVYEYDKMVESAMEEEQWTEEEAIDWIEYNTLRTIPYMGVAHPIVVYMTDPIATDDDDLEKYEENARGTYYSSNGDIKLVFESADTVPPISKDKYIVYNKI